MTEDIKSISYEMNEVNKKIDKIDFNIKSLDDKLSQYINHCIHIEKEKDKKMNDYMNIPNWQKLFFNVGFI
jgi:hypothetical protein